MSSEPVTEPAPGMVLNRSGLQTPRVRPEAIAREALMRTLAAQAEVPLVVVNAPAGYGKTTLLAQMAQQDDRPVAWVSVDRRDHDPVVFLSAVASALGQVDPRIAALEADMAEPMSVLDGPALVLANALRDVSTPVVLMVDDVHLLEGSVSAEVLDLLVGCVPPGSQIVLAGRSEPAFVATRRVGGQAIEIGIPDLGFGAGEAIDVFSACGVSLTAADAVAVVQRTEGWPAGIYLAALVAQRSRRESSAAQPISGNDRFVADYLAREVLATITPSLRAFLLHSSVLDEMSGPLCDHVLDLSGSEGRLREIERQNLFVSALDRERTWFRYHPLLRDVLLDELRAADPEAVDRIRRRAADWLQAQGMHDRAIDYLIEVGDAAALGPLLAGATLPFYYSGRLSSIERWLDRCAHDVVDHHPPIAVVAAWIAAMAGKPTTAQRWAAIAERSTFDGEMVDGSASFDSALAMIRALLCAHGPAAMERDAEFAVATEPEWSPWRETAIWLLGEARLLRGDAIGAERLFSGTIERSVGHREPHLVALAMAAMLAMDRGDWAVAADHLDLALVQSGRAGTRDYAASAMAFAAASQLALHDGDGDRRDEMLGKAMRGRSMATWAIPFGAVRLRVVLARVCAALGDMESVRRLSREIDEVLALRPDLGDLVGSADGVAALGASVAAESTLTPAELRLLPYLSTHHTFGEIGEMLSVSRNTVSSQAGAIYRKLGVSSRGAAVKRARELGLPAEAGQVSGSSSAASMS